MFYLNVDVRQITPTKHCWNAFALYNALTLFDVEVSQHYCFNVPNNSHTTLKCFTLSRTYAKSQLFVGVFDVINIYIQYIDVHRYL